MNESCIRRYSCCNKGRESSKDLVRPEPARIAASDESVGQLETATKLSQMLMIISVHSIIYGLGYHKVAAERIKQLFTDKQKNLRSTLSL